MWDEKLQELEERRTKAIIGGGQARIDKQHERNKLTARERLNILFDEGTFVEVNNLMTSRATDFGMDKKKIPGDGVVTGYGRVNGRVVFASSQDFTVGGGALGEYHAMKICNVMDMAMAAKVRIIFFIDFKLDNKGNKSSTKTQKTCSKELKKPEISTFFRNSCSKSAR